jgi:hypothetical protein
MKITKIALALMLCVSIISCSSDDENLEGQTGTLTLKFDNSVGGQDFIFGTSYNKSNNESYKLTTLKYIISNIRVKDSKGNIFTYPTENNVFIVDEANGNASGEILVVLDGVVAADYTEITFGIGIDQERYALGAEGQGDFLAKAQAAGMMWAWATGYRFMRFDGTYRLHDDVRLIGAMSITKVTVPVMEFCAFDQQIGFFAHLFHLRCFSGS